MASTARETLREYATSAGRKLTVKGNVIEGVKLLGLKSRNGREYLADGVRKAATLYEGAKVNIDHGNKGESRSYAHRFGTVKAVRFVEGDGLYGDFVFNPKRPLAEQLTWDAENAPQSVGFSHVAEGKTRRDGGKTIVEEILSVSSVDLVADPATTNGLFEEVIMDPETGMPAPGTADEGIKAAFRNAVVAAFDDEKLDTKATLAKMKEILKAYEKLQGGGEEKPEGDDPVKTEALAAENKTLRERLDKLEAANAVAAKRAKIDGELREAKLPAEAVTDVFVQSLLAADDAGRKAMIEDRKSLARLSRPISRGQESFSEAAPAAPKSAEEFAALLK